MGFENKPKRKANKLLIQDLRTKSQNKYIELYYQNVRGLRTKLNEFYAGIASSNADLFAITETGCNESVHDAELIPSDYSIIRCDRADGRKQGGALLVAAPRLELRRVKSEVNINAHAFELVSATVYMRERFLFLVCVVYIPPGSAENEYMILFRIIEQYCNNYSEVVVVGDFNLYSCSLSTKNYFEYFETYCEFTQSNTVGNCNDRCLDLVLSSLSAGGSVSVRAAAAPLVPVDAHHPPLEIAVTLRSRRHADGDALPVSDASEQAYYIGWNFYKADFPSMYSAIAVVDWTPMNNLDLEESLTYFYDILTTIFNDCVPKKKRSPVTSRYSYPEWYTVEIIRDIQLKANLHRQYKASKCKDDYEAFSRCRAKVKCMIELAHGHYKHQVQSRLLEDPRSFWNYTQSKRGSRAPQKILKNGVLLTAEQCANEFANYFHSVYNSERSELNVSAAIAAAGGQNGAARVHMEQLTLNEVRQALKKLKPKKSAGPDGIPPYLFRDCRFVLAEPLHCIFNKCLKAAVFPEPWKITRVVPVPKGGAGTQLEGYRPVAVLSTPAKVLESAIHQQIYAQVSAQLSDAQHGFRPARSTTSNLLNYMSHIAPTVDRGGQADAAYFDFRKAFDLVDNDVLLKKLASVGFTPHLLNFFASYMRDRQQYVEYGGYRSKPYFTRSGVSQGSNLGPLQFILMINDLPQVVKDAKCLLFADDLKLSLAVNDVNDCTRLQHDVDRVVKWSRDNLLQFNTTKCAVITFSKAKSPIHFDYNIDGAPMVRVSEVRDLGVTLNTELTFREHIVKCCKKAYRNLGFILRTVDGFTNINAVIALYNALVRSRLESNAVIWAPHEAKYSLMLERVQNKFARFLYMRLYGVYPYYPLMYPTLFVLGMVGYNELRVRRELTLVTYVFKILRGKLNNADVLAQIRLCVPDQYVWRRRRPPLLAVPGGRTNLVNKAPLTRAFRTLNLVAEKSDLFNCTLSEFTKFAMWVICYNNK